MMKKDEAVSAVVAMMLILAILCTVFAIYTTTYLPGLKQQDEILHSSDVEASFMRVSSDIDNLISFGLERGFTETVVLGGGDILLSPVKSAGALEVKNVTGSYSIDLNDNIIRVPEMVLNFTPQYTSWEKQGYLYRNGLVWIFKGSDKMTPAVLNLYSIADGQNYEREFLKKMIGSSAIRSVKGPLGTYVSALVIPKISAGNKKYVSGSGPAKITMKASYDFSDSISSMTIPAGTPVRLKNIDGSVVLEGTYAEPVTPIWLNIEVNVE